MTDLNEIRRDAMTLGYVDHAIMERLKQTIEEDRKISAEEANFLFALKRQFAKQNNDPEWEDYFIESMARYLLEDESSPGVVDEAEARWLRAHIQIQGKLDYTDRRLMEILRERSISLPPILHFKGQYTLMFEKILYGTRFITFLAVISSLVAAIVLFVKGTINVVESIRYFIDHLRSGSVDDHHLVAEFVSTIDIFLFSTVLFIFALGLYELFINKIDLVDRKKEDRPKWLVVKSIDDLKASLGKVILMILIVSFFEHSLRMTYNSVLELLYLGIGILLISAALYLTHKGPSH